MSSVPARRTAALTAVAAGLLVALAARGPRAETRVRASATAGVGASERLRLSEPQLQIRPRVVEVARLGLELAHRRPGSEHQGTYLAGITHRPRGGQLELSQALAWESLFSPWRSGGITLQADGMHGVMNGEVPLIEEPLDDVGPVPTGTFQYVGVSLGEALALEPVPRLAIHQGLRASGFAPFRGSQKEMHSLLLEHQLGLERLWARGSGRIDLALAHETQTTSRFEPALSPGGTGQLARLTAGWARELTPTLRSDLAAGVDAAREIGRTPILIGPTAHAALRWNGRATILRAGYDHGAMPSVVLGGIFQTDRLTARANGRFGHQERFRLATRLVLQQMRSLAPIADPAADRVVRLWTLRLQLGIRPSPRHAVEATLLVRHGVQYGGTLGRRVLGTFRRDAVLLTVTVGLPLRVGEEEPLPD